MPLTFCKYSLNQTFFLNKHGMYKYIQTENIKNVNERVLENDEERSEEQERKIF